MTRRPQLHPKPPSLLEKTQLHSKNHSLSRKTKISLKAPKPDSWNHRLSQTQNFISKIPIWELQIWSEHHSLTANHNHHSKTYNFSGELKLNWKNKILVRRIKTWHVKPKLLPNPKLLTFLGKAKFIEMPQLYAENHNITQSSRNLLEKTKYDSKSYNFTLNPELYFKNHSSSRRTERRELQICSEQHNFTRRITVLLEDIKLYSKNQNLTRKQQLYLKLETSPSKS